MEYRTPVAVLYLLTLTIRQTGTNICHVSNINARIRYEMDQLIFEMRKTESSKYSAKTHKYSFYATIPNSSPASLSLAIYTKYNIILTYLL